MDIWDVDFQYIYHLKKKNGTVLSLADEIIIFDNDYQIDKHFLYTEGMPPIRIDARVYMLVLTGDITLNVNYKTYRLEKGSVFRLNGRHIIDNVSISSNYKAYSIILSQDLIRSIINWVPELNDLSVSADRYKFLMTLNYHELNKIIEKIERLKDGIKEVEHAFHCQIVKIEATKFILDLADNYARERFKKGIRTEKETHGEETVRKFMSLIINHCREQHDVAFYAAQLNMTPGNLSRIIQKNSGKSPIKWISDALVAESKILLRQPGMNIKQVAYEMNFGDQSSFGKFFRKHTGCNPTDYKSSYRKVELF